MITTIDFTCSECKKEFKNVKCMTTGIQEVDDEMVCGSCIKKINGQDSYDVFALIIKGSDEERDSI